MANILHNEAQEFIFQLSFDTDAGASVPTNYYIGLDNRSSLEKTDTLTDLTTEPSIGVNGYERQAVSSTTGFTIQTADDIVKLTSSLVTFNGTGGSWGPVTKAFIATTEDNTGLLIASTDLSSSRTIIAGETFSFRLSITLDQCSL